MIRSTTATRFLKLSTALIAATIGSRAVAQTASSEAEGLQSLNDQKVMAELSDRGLDTLLDRLFDLKKTPEAQQKGIRTLRALHELSDPSVKMSNSERQRRIRTVVEGLPAALPNITDPELLEKYAEILLEQGVLHDANTLEYWGDNAVTQGRLKPVAQTVLTLMDKGSAAARAKADALANKLKGPDDPNAKIWDTLDQLANNGIYKRNMLAYYAALATDRSTPAGLAERAKIADKASLYLAELDNADSGVQATVRVMLGHLALVKGDDATAKTIFDSVANDTKKEIQPPPTANQQYEARYFRLVADVDSKDLAAAKKGLDDLLIWQKASMPQDKEVQDGIAAAGEMMRYRIFSAEAATASSPADQKKADDQAVAVLEELKKNRPDLAPIIFEQLINRLSPTKPVAQLDPLLLQGLMNKGLGESNKPDGQKLDTTVIDRAIDAAKEVLTRTERTGISAQLTDDAMILIPTLLDREGKTLEAAAAYLDYAEKGKATNLAQAKDAVDRAGFLVFDARKRNPTAVELGPVYDRLLPIAVNPPFNHIDLAYALGKRLRTLNKPVDAAKYLRLVDKSDANYLNAQYFLLLSLKDALDTKLDDADRAKVIAEIGAVGENVKALGSASAQPLDRFKAAHATLIAADLAANEQKPHDPQRALKLLGDFEQQVKGLPGESDLLGQALFVRVNAFMSTNQLDEATRALVALLAKMKGSDGIDLVRKLLDQLDKQFAKAEQAGDRPAMRDVAVNEAKLTGFLVDWSAKSQDPNVKKFSYQYRVFDANTKRHAGTLEDDPKRRQEDLLATEALYDDLLTPASHAQFVATLDPAKIKDGTLDPTVPDVAVQVGLAFVEFELKDYKSSLALLGEVLGYRRLGSPSMIVKENGEDKVKDNDLYWEATSKWYQASIAMAKQGGPDAKAILDGSKKGLKQLLILGGIPERWAPDFEAMRKDVLPDFTPQAPDTTNKVAAGLPAPGK